VYKIRLLLDVRGETEEKDMDVGMLISSEASCISDARTTVNGVLQIKLFLSSALPSRVTGRKKSGFVLF
jgi:hypothetical protein